MGPWALRGRGCSALEQHHSVSQGARHGLPRYHQQHLPWKRRGFLFNSPLGTTPRGCAESPSKATNVTSGRTPKPKRSRGLPSELGAERPVWPLSCRLQKLDVIQRFSCPEDGDLSLSSIRWVGLQSPGKMLPGWNAA